MRVITLNKQAVFNASQIIVKQIRDSLWIPDLVIGIASGGVFIARNIMEIGNFNTEYYEITCRRISTNRKKRLVLNKYLHLIPKSINNNLRILEHYIRLITNNLFQNKSVIDVDENLDIILALQKNRILIVDDAVDSGETMNIVRSFIIKNNATADIKTAAITQTWKKPLISADYCIYHCILIRFPWSADA